MYITDFKAGVSLMNNEALKWTYNYMMNSYKWLGINIKFQLINVFNQNSIMKLDLVLEVNNKFIEFSENHLDLSLFFSCCTKRYSRGYIWWVFSLYRFCSISNVCGAPWGKSSFLKSSICFCKISRSVIEEDPFDWNLLKTYRRFQKRRRSEESATTINLKMKAKVYEPTSRWTGELKQKRLNRTKLEQSILHYIE